MVTVYMVAKPYVETGRYGSVNSDAFDLATALFTTDEMLANLKYKQYAEELKALADSDDFADQRSWEPDFEILPVRKEFKFTGDFNE